MFTRLFAEAGLSLDRLRALVEVGAHGSIVRAADGDPARQSQYSRQIKELEDFFQVSLTERHGKGMRLTASGRELARISRFFLLGLSNFQRGCLAEGQTYRIGAPATFIRVFLLPALSVSQKPQPSVRFTVETVAEDEIERRLHDLTLDFGVVTRSELSRPLQSKDLGECRLSLWVPKALCQTASQAARGFDQGRLPLAWPIREWPVQEGERVKREPVLVCDSFDDARLALDTGTVATLLPDFLRPIGPANRFHQLEVPALEANALIYRLAWNPRMLRLNPHASRRLDSLIEALEKRWRALLSHRRGRILLGDRACRQAGDHSLAGGLFPVKEV